MTIDKTPSEAELLPCPFCGEAAKHSFNSLYGDMSMASCKSCGATAYAPKWNRRAVLAKWGQPAQAVDPVALLVRKNSSRDGQSAAAPPNSPSYGLAWANQRMYVYAAPQPTQPQAGAVPLGTCEWSHEESDGFWESSCGDAWRFDDGGPKENNMHFCHHCGKTLRIKGGQHGAE